MIEFAWAPSRALCVLVRIFALVQVQALCTAGERLGFSITFVFAREFIKLLGMESVPTSGRYLWFGAPRSCTWAGLALGAWGLGAWGLG